MEPDPSGPGTDAGLPVLADLAAAFASAAGATAPEPLGGGAELREAASGYWARRGIAADPEHVVAAPGGRPLLLALLAAAGGDVLLGRPCASWYEPLARLAGRPAYHSAVPAECGGVPDPFALLETVRRVRAEGGAPRVLVLAVADDPTGTVAPPELLHEVCEAAAGEGLLIVSDETWRDTVHDPHDTVVVGPAEMLPERVVVLNDLAGALTPPGWPVALARFPATARGAELRAGTLATLDALGARLSAPVAAGAGLALAEPPAVRARTAAAARAFGAVAGAAYRALTDAGVLCRPPRAGTRLYADFVELGEALEARGVTDSVELERHLGRRLGRPVPGGHRFGDPPPALRARLSVLPLLGVTDEQRQRALDAPDPLRLPHVADALRDFAAVFAELSGSERGAGE
ncbi:aminotransferase class I/II-fold pyridoxal phosphate-dependent enzyme [Streptomyces sp. LX-29]|uniref:aminotransferase class I/II-fold pyridoxal phosphate-dependent enzyme n=1 Tax=Streptomyces sp. LX-29 TaxID=2900152 RepID=UPI00240E8BD2|nr:aminotransferase class I/II-fold pyridoxal phosphate-dependent enzyme [Streptomyces sp. LX-29]WFB11507.1 aminotransferase class I/II-fold pyridoxal phosphate-dependent enzyme [Streptomyces sp. LX-29]